MFICPECRSVYMQNHDLCERDQVSLVPVQANQDPRTYPLLNQELDGRYHLIGGLGQGGVGTVYLANHIHLDQLSAVKFLDIDMLGEVDEEQREESLQDFVKEAKLAMMLRHDYVVRVMDYGVHERCPFLVMEYVPGPSLLRRMNAGERFDVQQCVNVISRLADALSAFHDRKLVHRDLKPANVILDPRDNGELTLVDLGLVKDLSNEARSSTHPLALRGTPGYLAPEQVPSWVLSSAGVDVTSEKQPVDARVDVYALGILAFELLSGRTPYPKGMSPTKVIVYTCTQDTPNLAQICPHIDQECPGLSQLVMSMMAKRPKDRPLDARGVLNALNNLKFRETEESVAAVEINSEINRATQALVDHVRSTPLASSDHTSDSYQAHSIQSGRPSSTLSPHPHLTPSPAGSLIPPPVSLQRHSSGESREMIYQEVGQGSTVHFDGTMDEAIDVDDLSISEDQRDIHTEINDRPVTAYAHAYTPPYASNQDQVVAEIPNYASNDNTKIFWIGVVLIAIVIGIFSALLGNVEENKAPRRIVMGNRPVAVKNQNASKQSRQSIRSNSLIKNNTQVKSGLVNNNPSLKVPSQQETTFAQPRLTGTEPKSNDQPLNKQVESNKSTPGIVELKMSDKSLSASNTQTDHTPSYKTKTKTKARAKTKYKAKTKRKVRSSRKKSLSSKTQERNSNKPLTKSQYRLLKLQVENLLRNQRVTEAKRRLSAAKRRLKPSDEFYLEINMLLDSISQ